MGFFKKEEEEVKIYSPKEQTTQETVREKNVWNLQHIFLAFWIFVLFVCIGIASGFFVLRAIQRVILWTVLVVIYAIILFFLLEPSKIREIERKETKTIEKEVLREIEKPVIKEVVKEVEKPVLKEVVREVEKPVYYQVKGPKLNIPKYDYVGSSLTHIYHKRDCRISKSIKKKYKEYNNDINFFKSKNYNPCKICITRQVKS